MIERCLGYVIPDGRSPELEANRGYFFTVDFPEKALQIGDIVGFSRKVTANLQYVHLGVVRTVGSDPQIIHAAKRNGGVKIEQLTHMVDSPEHANVQRVWRPRFRVVSDYDLETLQLVGFFS